MKNYAELLALKKDAQRVIRQAKVLTDLMPARATQYADQLKACLLVINKAADKLSKS